MWKLKKLTDKHGVADYVEFSTEAVAEALVPGLKLVMMRLTLEYSELGDL